MRIIDPNLLQQLGAEVYRPANLVTTDINGTFLRFTSWSSQIGYDSEIYTPRGMNIGSIGYGSANIANGCSLDIDDIDRTFYAMLGSSGAKNWEVVIKLVVLNEYGTVYGGASTIFRGYISAWSFSSGKMTMKLRSPFVKWSRTTTRLFSTSCAVKVFKSVQCGYSGSESTCARTYKQCGLYNNQVNFQGFRWLEDLASRRIDVSGETPPPTELPMYSSAALLQGRR
jgi:hypothetical protein